MRVYSCAVSEPQISGFRILGFSKETPLVFLSASLLACGQLPTSAHHQFLGGMSQVFGMFPFLKKKLWALIAGLTPVTLAPVNIPGRQRLNLIPLISWFLCHILRAQTLILCKELILSILEGSSGSFYVVKQVGKVMFLWNLTTP